MHTLTLLIALAVGGVEVFYDYALLTREAAEQPHLAEVQFSVPSHALASSDLGETELEIVAAVNAYRALHDLAPLAIHPTLQKMARDRVGIYAHDHPRYGWSHEHAKQAGFPGPVTDNLAQGYAGGTDAVDGWATSDGHARQMRGFAKINGRWIDQRFDSVGAAASGRNFILVLGRAAASTQPQGASYERKEAIRSGGDPGRRVRRSGRFRR